MRGDQVAGEVVVDPCKFTRVKDGQDRGSVFSEPSVGRHVEGLER